VYDLEVILNFKIMDEKLNETSHSSSKEDLPDKRVLTKEAQKLWDENSDGIKDTFTWNDITHRSDKLSRPLTVEDLGMEGEHKKNVSEKEGLVVKIQKRAENASDKVKKRIEENFIPYFNQLDSRDTDIERFLSGLRNDFSVLAENPEDESGGGHYKGWTSEEIRELYAVLYGEKME
jgi:hypothetical protein